MKFGIPIGTLMLMAVAALFTANVARQSRAPATGIVGPASQDRPKRVYNGNPSDRIWQIGTRRILGVFSGPSHFPPRTIADDENPELPAKLKRAYDADYRRWKRSNGNKDYEFPIIFADFEVCRLEPEKKGEMQAVCIESAKNIFLQKSY